MPSGSPSTQVGLFSTQISEQILRLRALAQGREGVSGPDQVALKRAVMATRLLAGSARILQFADIQSFLDRLLNWMQAIEQGGQALSSTEQLILESVIETEERLMAALDDQAPVDFSQFQAELSELHKLMERHDDQRREQRELRAALQRTRTPEVASTVEDNSAAGLLDRLGRLVIHLENLEALDEDPSLNELALEQLSELNRRLGEGIQRWSHEVRRSLRAAAESSAAASWPRGDELLDPLWEHLQARSQAIGLPIEFTVEGEPSLLGVGLRDVIAEILTHLLDDCCNGFQNAQQEDPEFHRGEILLHIGLERGRLEIALRDNAPAVQRQSLLSGVDALSFYRGVRRSRYLIQQLNGIIQVEPAERRGVRFMLQLPSDLMAQTYQLVSIGERLVAVPWVRVVHHVRSHGLVYETDESGESFVRGGRNIPLTELSNYASALPPRAGLSDQILVVGSVERRIGIFCDAVGRLVESAQLGDPPADWVDIAYGTLQCDGAEVPILDVVRLVELRLSSDQSTEVAGSAHDPMLDSYVPREADRPKSRSERRRLRIMLVNRSDFRRREIARVLQRQGHELSFSSDLLAALRREDRPQVDLIITDLRLGHEGLEDLSGVRAAYGKIPIVLTSSASRGAGEELAAKVGADACWLDPFNPVDLNRILDQWT